MKIESFETKYSVGDIVYTIAGSNVYRCMIHKVEINIINENPSTGRYMLESPKKTKTSTDVKYYIVYLNDDGENIGYPSDKKNKDYVTEDEIDETFDGLIKKRFNGRVSNSVPFIS